ncbi:MAG: type IV secretory system conjugative DNA transfer family protein [Gammaproteobacteria bacterium]|nr:type IV secretory system conjugative DNA transfer family protein [Gammaproteobacteria bacterium]
MTPHAGAPPSAHSAKARALKVSGIALIGFVSAAYLGGYFFLWSVGLSPRTATPLTLARYGFYYADYPSITRRVLICGGVGGGLILASAGALLLPPRRSLHGDARFANRRELAAAGLFGDQGIILGRLGRRCLMLVGQQGVALAAPPRAGKGTGVVIPNLLNWPGSVICVDIKRENWTLTAGFRSTHGQRCFLFDPFSEEGRTARWNPFHYVSEDPIKRVNDLQRIAEMLYPDPPNVDPFWTASARSLFLGIALYLFETPSSPKTVGEVLRQGMASDDEGFGHHWKRVIEGRNKGEHPLSPQCVRALYDVIDLAPVTASSIRKTFTSRLDLWLNPILDAATSANDFDLRDLRRKPLSIYVGVNPDDLHRLRPVLALFFQQAIGLQTRVLPEHDASLKHQVLVLLDEFTALGRIPIIAESISYLPGYNVRVLLVIQTPAQLREVYGPNGSETMLKSLAARIVFAPKDMSDAREISEELGNTTVKVKAYSRAQMGFGDTKRQNNVNVSEQRRALLLPQEVKDLGSDRALIFCEGLRPIRCQKIRYFKDRRFVGRLLPPPIVTKAEPVTLEPVHRAPPAQSKAGEGARDREEFRVREATVEDIERIDELTLEDFAGPVAEIEVPETDRLSNEQMGGLVSNFLEALHAQ